VKPHVGIPHVRKWLSGPHSPIPTTIPLSWTRRSRVANPCSQTPKIDSRGTRTDWRQWYHWMYSAVDSIGVCLPNINLLISSEGGFLGPLFYSLCWCACRSVKLYSPPSTIYTAGFQMGMCGYAVKWSHKQWTIEANTGSIRFRTSLVRLWSGLVCALHMNNEDNGG
jgi:hypothetical protein